jgi:hypothetical protein
MFSSEEKPDRISTVIAVLIAVVSVLAAVGAWRVAVASSNAGNADADGLLASVDQQDALTGAYVAVSARLAAFARSAENDAIATALQPIEAAATDSGLKARLEQERTSRIAAAEQLRFAIPPQYITRNNTYDENRDIGETSADLTLQRDTFPEPHFTFADTERAKALLRMRSSIASAMRLFCLPSLHSLFLCLAGFWLRL